MTKSIAPLFALNRIRQGKEAFPANSLFVPATEEERERLLELGAAREPEGAELKLAGPATTKPEASSTVSPPDNDGDKKPGGSIDELDQMTVAALKRLAAAETIDLGEATKSDDIKKAIRAARASKAADADAADVADVAEDADVADDAADADDAEALLDE